MRLQPRSSEHTDALKRELEASAYACAIEHARAANVGSCRRSAGMAHEE